MTRKDTIIIAVFVNAALLIALFITAIKGGEETSLINQKEIISQAPPPAIAEPIAKKEIKTAQGDEIDQVLKEFSEKKVVTDEKSTPKIDFAKELEAITKAAAPPQKPNPATPSKNTLNVTVQKGDSLEKIARIHGVKVNEIIDHNNLSTTTLQIGQVLKIPGKKTESRVAPTPSTSQEFYTVKQGDNPWTIAVKNHLKVDELLKLNNLNEEKARRLKPGDKLRIK